MIENISFTPMTVDAVASVAPKTEDQRAIERVERVPEIDKKIPIDQEKPRDPEQARYEAVRRATENFVSNFYAVSDIRFTIYKEVAKGEAVYFTRITSLRDGRVTVVPEPDVYSKVRSYGGSLVDGVI